MIHGNVHDYSIPQNPGWHLYKTTVYFLIISFLFINCHSINSERHSNIYIDKLNKLPDSNLTSIEIDTLIKYYGDKKLNDSLKGFFIVKNNGNKPLYFIKVQKGCFCLNISNDVINVIILPGKTFKLFFEVSKFNDVGYFSKAIILYGNFSSLYRTLLVECKVSK